MREICTYGSMRGRAYPAGASRSTLHPSRSTEVIEAMGKGAEAKIVLKVCDDAGAPVSNASVRVEFDLLPDPHSFYGKTDSKGIVVVRGKTNGNKISFFVGKDGYYGTRSERSFVPMGAERDVKAGKWQPYPFEDSVVLKLIRTPIPLVSRHGIYKQKWLHSDMKDMAYFFVFKLYDQLTQEGVLK